MDVGTESLGTFAEFRRKRRDRADNDTTLEQVAPEREIRRDLQPD
jgi:hypothetical protein